MYQFLSIACTIAFFFIYFNSAYGQNSRPFTKEKLYERFEYKWKKKILDQQQNSDGGRSHELSKFLQDRNQGESNLSNTLEYPESEVHAAINPLDTNNIIASIMKYLDNGAGLEIVTYYTLDGGDTWEISDFEPLAFAGTLFGGGDPILAFEPDGTAFLYWLVAEQINFLDVEITIRAARSMDQGASWEVLPAFVDQGIFQGILGVPFSGEFVDKHWASVDHSQGIFTGNTYIAYAHLDIEFPGATYQIRVKTKEAGSDLFSEPVVIEKEGEPFAFAQFTTIDVAPDGKVHLVFAGATETDSVAALYHSVSVDGGTSFSIAQKISDFHLQCFPADLLSTCDFVGIAPSRIYPCNHLRINPVDGSLYLVWTADGFTSQITEGTDIYFSKSIDDGVTWSTPVIVNEDASTSPERHNYYPSIAVNDIGSLFLTWYDRRADTMNVLTEYYFQRSEDSGETFAQSFPISLQPSDFSLVGLNNLDFGIGEYTQIVASNSWVRPFWSDGRTNDGNLELYTTKIQLDSTDNPISQVYEWASLRKDFTVFNPFPNPSTSEFTLEVYSKTAQAFKEEIYRIDGSLISENTRSHPSGNVRWSYDLKMEPAGTFFIRIWNAKGSTVRKVVLIEN